MLLSGRGAQHEAAERMGRGYVCFQKPFSLLSQRLGPCPSVIKVALNKAWHIQGGSKEQL